MNDSLRKVKGEHIGKCIEKVPFCISPFFVTALRKKKFLLLCATKESRTALVQHDDINDIHDDRMYFFFE